MHFIWLPFWFKGADKNVQNVQIITEQCIQELDRNGDGKVSKGKCGFIT